MFACTELVTGFDDFGKVIFLQSSCDRARSTGVPAKGSPCYNCHYRDGVSGQSSYRTTEETSRFSDVLNAMLEAPYHQTNVFPLR